VKKNLKIVHEILQMYSTWPYDIPNGPLDLYSLAIKTKSDGYDQVRPVNDGQHAARPDWAKFRLLFTCGSSVESYRSGQNFWLLFSTVLSYVLILKNGLGYILCNSFTNSSGDPAKTEIDS
jgi:hypothetical protein